MDAEQLKKSYQQALRDFMEIDEALTTGDFLKDVVPPESFYAARQKYVNFRDEHSLLQNVRDAAFAALKLHYQVVAREHYNSTGEFYRESFDDVDVKCRKSVVYDLDKVQEIALNRGLSEKLHSTGIISAEITLDKEKLAQLPEEERVLFNPAMQVVLRDVTITKK